jgi:hypothetical protein
MSAEFMSRTATITAVGAAVIALGRRAAATAAVIAAATAAVIVAALHMVGEAARMAAAVTAVGPHQFLAAAVMAAVGRTTAKPTIRATFDSSRSAVHVRLDAPRITRWPLCAIAYRRRYT